MFEIYLIRHGIAEESNGRVADEQRTLTNEGRKKTRSVARRLHTLEVRFRVLLCSPLVRARQTAELLVEADLAERIETFAPLAPGGSLASLRHWLLASPGDGAIGLVGHQPGLGLWAEELLWGTAHQGFDIKKAGVVRIALNEPEARGTLVWMLSPRVLGA